MKIKNNTNIKVKPDLGKKIKLYLRIALVVVIFAIIFFVIFVIYFRLKSSYIDNALNATDTEIDGLIDSAKMGASPEEIQMNMVTIEDTLDKLDISIKNTNIFNELFFKERGLALQSKERETIRKLNIAKQMLLAYYSG